MPVLTKAQVIEAAFELLPEDRMWVWERLIEEKPLQVSEEQKEVVERPDSQEQRKSD